MMNQTTIIKQQLAQSNQKTSRKAFAFIGILLGVILMVISLQTYFDIQSLLGSSGGQATTLTINKKVSFLNTLGVSSHFKASEIEALEEQSFINEVGAYQSNKYRLVAGMSSLGFQTDLFFESVPSTFTANETSKFNWSVGDNEVPIILSKDYLTLYNFGFAPSQGLPQFTNRTINKAVLDLYLIGKQNRIMTKGRIVGFSDNINTILVPESFLAWSNKKLSNQAADKPSKLILEVDNPNHPELLAFIKSKGYEISSGKVLGDDTKSIINIMIVGIVILGLLLFALSMFVFNQHFQIIISEAKQDIVLLNQLGYSLKSIKAELLKSLNKIIVANFLTVLGLLVLVRFGIQYAYSYAGFEIKYLYHWIVLSTLALIFIIFYFTNKYHIQSSVERL